MDALIGFFSGVGVSLTGALIGSILSRDRDRQKKLEEHRFQIYMKLMDVYADYFWFTSAEMRREELRTEIRQRCRTRSWEVVDMLRAADDLEHLDEVLDILLGHGYRSAIDRYEAMGGLLTKIGKQVNPRYQKKIAEISKGNIQLLGSGGKSNAPGSTFL